ncbi:MAG: glycyl-radical enzyme activating protein [Melioribacteraceae bacterium]|nr:glycyl-radical enzyme activating protein [Melioribacteraceae bacterium]
MNGIIFDIQKFALHDGPGIRTTVFLKGCPLKCVWCCNPESLSLKPELAFNNDKCTNCMKCIPVCETGALINAAGKLEVQFDKCTACGDCIDVCVDEALSIYGYETDVESIISEVEKDKSYFTKSGGGLTLSGGDALLQFDFAMTLLKSAKAKGISTCLQTEGFGARDKFEKISPYVDQFLFDYKISNEEDHIKYTGVSGNQIIENLEFLNRINAEIILRCIILPGINDNEEHFAKIAKLYKDYKSIEKIELMAYHNYGENKYKLLGKEYSLDIKSVDNKTVNGWLEILRTKGVNKVIKG